MGDEYWSDERRLERARALHEAQARHIRSSEDRRRARLEGVIGAAFRSRADLAADEAKALNEEIALIRAKYMHPETEE